MDAHELELEVFRHAAEFSHPVFRVEVKRNVSDPSIHVFIVDALKKDGQSPAHYFHFLLEERGDQITFRAPTENDPRPDGEEETEEEGDA